MPCCSRNEFTGESAAPRSLTMPKRRYASSARFPYACAYEGLPGATGAVRPG